jgi:hypothetical protein
MFLKLRFFLASKLAISKAIEEDDQFVGEEEIGEWPDRVSHHTARSVLSIFLPFGEKVLMRMQQKRWMKDICGFIHREGNS